MTVRDPTINNPSDVEKTGDARTAGDRSEPTADVAELEEKDGKPPLPFSRARCIALVATVTGASFLNVRSIRTN